MKRERILLDSNLLLLLVVGIAGIQRYAHHKRLNHFNLPGDFEILSNILGSGTHIILTPNTLTETSNLLRQIAQPARSELSRVLAVFIATNKEVMVASEAGAARSEFAALGLTDSILLHLAAGQIDGSAPLLLTMDFNLYISAMMHSMRVVNFHELRGL